MKKHFKIDIFHSPISEIQLIIISPSVSYLMHVETQSFLFANVKCLFLVLEKKKELYYKSEKWDCIDSAD